MTLDPNNDIVRQIIQSYQGYAEALDGEKRKRFDELFGFLYEFVEAINAKGEPFPEEAALVTLVLKQHLMIEDLKEQLITANSKLKDKVAELEAKIILLERGKA